MLEDYLFLALTCLLIIGGVALGDRNVQTGENVRLAQEAFKKDIVQEVVVEINKNYTIYIKPEE